VFTGIGIVMVTISSTGGAKLLIQPETLDNNPHSVHNLPSVSRHDLIKETTRSQKRAQESISIIVVEVLPAFVVVCALFEPIPQGAKRQLDRPLPTDA
jgi:hypothetical protein